MMRTAPCALLMMFLGCSSTSAADTDTDTDASTSTGSEESSTAADSSSTGTPLVCEAETMIPAGAAIDANGTIDPLEWAGATVVAIPVQATEVNVILSHDGANLNVGFQPLAEGGLIMFPELYIDPMNDKSVMFGADDWWFHTDDQECGAQGMLDAWPGCVDDNPDWDSTPGLVGPANAVEYSIPFALLGIDLSTSCEIGLALRVTNTQTVAEIWPAESDRNEPVTWATVALDTSL